MSDEILSKKVVVNGVEVAFVKPSPHSEKEDDLYYMSSFSYGKELEERKI